jgi:hypothetical protein
VLLHGDDDLLLPNSIKERRAMMIAANADMGLSKPVSRIYFSADGDRALFVSWEQLNGPSLGWLDWGERHLKSHESSFISNHTYRYTPCFRDGLSLAREACATQEWVDSRNRNLMLPYYLPFAIKQAGGRVTALDSICVVRGADLSEITNYPYGVANWNTCFVNLLAFCLFRSGYFSSAGIDNAAVLTHFEDSIRRMLPTLLLDRRLKWPVVAETLRRAGLSCWDLLRVRALAGYKALLLSKLGLTGWRIARKFRQCSQPAEAVINAVWSRRGATSNSCS